MKVESSKILVSKKPLMKELLDLLLAKYPYASILANDSSAKSYSVSGNGINIVESDWMTEVGFVVRIYDGESYGEYAFNDLTKEAIPEIVDAISDRLMPWAGKLPAEVSKNIYGPLSDEAVTFEKSSEFEIDPTTYGDGKIIERLSELRKKLIESDEVVMDAQIRFEYQIYHKIFLSKNKDLTQNILWSDGAMVGIGLRGQEMKVAYRPISGDCGIEVMNNFEPLIPEVTETLKLLMISEPMIPGEYDCICTPEVTGMIVHEAFGHGVEMDMFVKDRALAKANVGEYVASPLVTMHDGAAIEHQTATFFFDDEGTITTDTVVIDKGVLKTGFCDAQAALALGCKPTGNGRREASSHKAYTRMTNTFFEPGTDKLEDMIASIDYGFLLSDASSGMEDPKNWGIQCMVSVAREIKNGQFTGKVFSPIVLTGYVPDLLKSISMMSDAKELSGSGMCGKGYKEWVKVSDGGPYIKAKIRLG